MLDYFSHTGSTANRRGNCPKSTTCTAALETADAVRREITAALLPGNRPLRKTLVDAIALEALGVVYGLKPAYLIDTFRVSQRDLHKLVLALRKVGQRHLLPRCEKLVGFIVDEGEQYYLLNLWEIISKIQEDMNTNWSGTCSPMFLDFQDATFRRNRLPAASRLRVFFQTELLGLFDRWNQQVSPQAVLHFSCASREISPVALAGYVLGYPEVYTSSSVPLSMEPLILVKVSAESPSGTIVLSSFSVPVAALENSGDNDDRQKDLRNLAEDWFRRRHSTQTFGTNVSVTTKMVCRPGIIL